MTPTEVLELLSAHDGLIRFIEEPDEPRAVRVMLRVRQADKRVVVVLPVEEGDNAVAVALDAAEEALGELQRITQRRSLTLVQ